MAEEREIVKTPVGNEIPTKALPVDRPITHGVGPTPRRQRSLGPLERLVADLLLTPLDEVSSPWIQEPELVVSQVFNYL